MNVQCGQILKAVQSKKDVGEQIGTMLQSYKKPEDQPEAKSKMGRDVFEITSSIMEFMNPTSGMSETEKQEYLAKINQKLKRGEKLTGEEMEYLRETDPGTYAQVARVQTMRESLENQLKQCQSKQAVAETYGAAMTQIGEDDPMKGAISAAYGKVLEEFKGSGDYTSLPEKKEDDGANNDKS